MTRSTGKSCFHFYFVRQLFLTIRRHCRPFKIVPKSDGRPAVEVESNGKTQQFVRSFHPFLSPKNLRFAPSVSRRALFNGPHEDARDG